MDSGAQYLDGTTDVTRTMHFGASLASHYAAASSSSSINNNNNGNDNNNSSGVSASELLPKPSQRMVDSYTLVLKGHTALARLVFPEGTTGARMDTVARMALWRCVLAFIASFYVLLFFVSRFLCRFLCY